MVVAGLLDAHLPQPVCIINTSWLLIVIVAQGCSMLTSLNLWVCASVSDAGICLLAAACTQLESLDLRLCSKVR